MTIMQEQQNSVKQLVILLSRTLTMDAGSLFVSLSQSENKEPVLTKKSGIIILIAHFLGVMYSIFFWDGTLNCVNVKCKQMGYLLWYYGVSDSFI